MSLYIPYILCGAQRKVLSRGTCSREHAGPPAASFLRPSLPPLAKPIMMSAVPANTLRKDSGISLLHKAKAFATS